MGNFIINNSIVNYTLTVNVTMAKNNLTISLPLEQIQQLTNLAKEGESAAVCAKRILLAALSESNPPQIPNEVCNRLNELEKAITEINKALKVLSDNDDLMSIEIYKLQGPIYETPEQQIEFDNQVEKWIKEEEEEANPINHTQLAQKLGVNKSTISRWAKKGTSPQGEWLWDGKGWKSKQA